MPADGTAAETVLRNELSGLVAEHALARSLIHCRAPRRQRLVAQSGRALVRIRTQLALSTRDQGMFQRKLQRVAAALERIAGQAGSAGVEALQAQASRAAQSLQALLERPAPDGDDLLPVTAEIEAVATLVHLVAELCGIPLPGESERTLETSRSSSGGGPLAEALRQRATQLAREHGKQVQLVCSGLTAIPPDWQSTIFDITSQLLRNAIEHGIETPEQRLMANKPATGQISIRFTGESDKFQLTVSDDGGGLDAMRISERAFARGTLKEKPGRADPRQIVRMIFVPGLSTAQQPEGRGNGMNIVRDQLRRLGGRISVATRGGQYTRIEMELPAPLPVQAGPAADGPGMTA